jgi:hypothetical protein
MTWRQPLPGFLLPNRAAVDLSGNLLPAANAIAGPRMGVSSVESEEEETDKMTLCIAGACKHKGSPAIVMLTDSRVERGLASPIFSELRIGAEDAQKMRDVGDDFRALLSGPPTMGDELLAKCDAAIVRFEKAVPNADSDIVITAFFEELKLAARERKREIIDRYIGMNTVLSSRQEFIDKARTVFSEAHYNRLQDELRSLSLGGDVIIAGFHGDDQIIVRLDAFGNVHWEDHYSVIGAGSDIAFAILALNEYDEDSIEVPECVFRLFEAKAAAHTNRTVGETTAFEVFIKGQGSFDISDEFFELKKSKRRFISIPEIIPPDNFLVRNEEDDKSRRDSGTENSDATSTEH